MFGYLNVWKPLNKGPGLDYFSKKGKYFSLHMVFPTTDMHRLWIRKTVYYTRSRTYVMSQYRYYPIDNV